MTGFQPSAADDRELGLYFNAGPNPKMQWTSRAQRDRRAKVETALDGRGYYLQLYYTGRLVATEPDRDLAAQLVSREYRAFVGRFRARGRKAKPEPHTVLTDAEIERLVTRPVPARLETVLGSDGKWHQIEGEAPDTLANLGEALACGIVERSTWGRLRVSPGGARTLLTLSHWFDGEAQLTQVRCYEDDAALFALRARLAALPPLPEAPAYDPPPNRNITPEYREDVRWVLAEQGVGIDPRRVERIDREASHTTVTELADRHGVRRAWVRDALVQLGCPGARVKRAPISTEWLATPAGRRFWVALFAESRRARAERRDHKARVRREAAELHFSAASQKRLDLRRPLVRASSHITG